MWSRILNILSILLFMGFHGENITVNGVRVPRNAQDKAFPYVVQLGYNSNFGNLWLCAGSLLNPVKVLTTAECAKRKLFGSPIIARNNFGQANIQRILKNGDIAILSLTKPVPINHTACISSYSQRLAGITAGWGSVNPDNRLHFTINKELNTEKLKTFEFTGSTAKTRSEGESICIGDEGGPFLYPVNEPDCTHEIYGLLKQWIDCGEKSDAFGQYFTLSGYKTWIQENI